MRGTVERARRLLREQVEMLYEDCCTVYERQDVIDKETKVSKKEPIAVLKDEPCRLSFTTLEATEQANPAAEKKQVVKLFLRPEVEIKEGCKIDIVHQGKMFEYARSGIPAMYTSHQEIVLKSFERWA